MYHTFDSNALYDFIVKKNIPIRHFSEHFLDSYICLDQGIHWSRLVMMTR